MYIRPSVAGNANAGAATPSSSAGDSVAIDRSLRLEYVSHWSAHYRFAGRDVLFIAIWTLSSSGFNSAVNVLFAAS
ncbi:hypothetical protein Busp01_33920 [Trinickia caryophylli]|nr:hypothetical protein Busp01_33920 [Trinickia caryophylli]